MHKSWKPFHFVFSSRLGSWLTHILLAISFLGCSVYQSNGRKNFESKSPNYVVSFSLENCEITIGNDESQSWYSSNSLQAKEVRVDGQIYVTQQIPHDGSWYTCTEVYESEPAWQNQLQKFNLGKE